MLDWRIPDFAIPSDFKREKHPKSDFLRLSPEPKTPAQVGSGRHQTYFPHGRPTDQKSSIGSLQTYTMISNCEYMQFSASLIIILLILAKRKTACSAYYCVRNPCSHGLNSEWVGNPGKKNCLPPLSAAVAPGFYRLLQRITIWKNTF